MLVSVFLFVLLWTELRGLAELARDEGKIARAVAKEMSPEYHQPG